MPRLLILTASLLAACTEDPETTPTEETNPADAAFAERLEPGSFAVGYRQIDVTYRPEVSDENRTIPVEVWYPAMPDGATAGYAVGGIISIDAPLATTADPADPGDLPFPVAVYSHGNGGVGLVGYPFGEYLASWGWVVLAPDHVGNTALELVIGQGDPFLRSVIDRPQDISATLDWLENVGADDPLAELADPSSVLLVGHSFGGYTSFAAAGAKPSADRLDPDCPDKDDPNCVLFEDPAFQDLLEQGFADDRITALVPQAPAIRSFEASELTDLSLPTMLQSGAVDITTTPETSSIPTWAAIDGEDDVWIDMPRGGHITFLSICDDLEDELITTFQASAFEDGCGEQFIPVSEALPVLSAYIGLFGDAHIRGLDTQGTIEDATPPEGFVLTTQ